MSKASYIMMRSAFWLMIFCFSGASALQGAKYYYVAPSASALGNGSIVNPWPLQVALTNAVITPGDTIWLRGGTYSPPYTNAASMRAPQWSVNLAGATNNLITFRSYAGEWAKIDRQWRFGGSTFLCFRDLEFYDSYKGRNPTNTSYPNGPWAHFDGNQAYSSGCQWINCIVHDVNNCWSGGTSGDLVRGCITWYVGMNPLEHLSYPAPNEFSGNITAWQSQDAINLNTRAFLGHHNIFFGGGQSRAGNATYGGDFRLSTSPYEVSFNYVYN